MQQSMVAIRNSLVGFVSQVISAAVGILVVPFIIRRIGNEAYGVFLLGFSIMSVLEFLRGGVAMTCIVTVARGKERGDFDSINRTLSAAVAFTLVPACIGFLGLACGGESIYRFFEVDPSLHAETLAVMIMMGCVTLVCFPMYPFQGVLYGYQRQDLEYLANSIGQVLRAALIVALLILFRSSVVVVTAVTAASLVATQLWITWSAHRIMPELRLHLRGVRKPDFAPLWSYGSFLVLTQILLTLDAQIGNWITGKALGVEYVTFLYVVTMVTQLAWRTVGQVTGGLMAIAARYHALEAGGMLEQTLRRGSRYSFIMAGLMLGGLLPQMDVFQTLWMGKEYAWLAPYAVALGIVVSLTSSSSCASQMVIGMGDSTAPFWTMVVATAGGVSTMLISVLGFGAGLGGIVAGLCVSQFLRWLTAMWLASRRIAISRWLLLWEAYLQPMIALAPAVGGVLALRWWLQPDSWVMLAAIMAAGGILFLLAMLPFVTKVEWQLIREVMGKVRVMFLPQRT
jgi:O-antigen/teichoic acid export membrane protein